MGLSIENVPHPLTGIFEKFRLIEQNDIVSLLSFPLQVRSHTLNLVLVVLRLARKE